MSSYDTTPYPSSPVPQAHPSRLAAIARLFGLPAALPAKARVLEIGCADGTNLLPLADAYPQAQFLGIDASSVQIATGRKAAEAAGLCNIELRHQDIVDFPAEAGQFDYIVAHGVYSWVKEPVREKLLALCARHLTENGVAFVSYNALPGWNMRRSIRDMMLFHTRALAEPKDKVVQARALLGFLADSVPVENNAYGLMLKGELETISRVTDNYLLHDYLEEENTPFYFSDFVARAGQHGLQYLGEPSLSQMLAANFSDSVSKTLSQMGQIVQQEQYMDFLRNRSFRQTLLCNGKAQLSRKLSPEPLKTCAFRGLFGMPSQGVDLNEGVAVPFAAANGGQISASDPFLKAIFVELAGTGFQAISYQALLAAARAKAQPFLSQMPANLDQVQEATLLANLFNLYAKGLIDVFAQAIELNLQVPDNPAVSALVRYQAVHARGITNRAHYALPADALGREVIAACDGQRTKDDIVSVVIQQVKAGKMNVQEDGKPVTDEKRLGELLAPQVENLLRSLARNGFFAR